jgi:hypothetical protein
MLKGKAIIATSAALLSAALVALLFNSSENQNIKSKEQSVKLPADQILTFDCEIPVTKPNSITLTCADGGMMVTDITWDSWSSQGAQGSGIYLENNCEPDCASGKFSKTQVDISLTKLIEFDKKYFLKDLAIKAIKGKTFPNDDDELQWDLSNNIFDIEGE